MVEYDDRGVVSSIFVDIVDAAGRAGGEWIGETHRAAPAAIATVAVAVQIGAAGC
jgi:hypothetical protein